VVAFDYALVSSIRNRGHIVAQARRLESQLYQRAQDLRTIEMTQRQAALARAQVHQLEQHHLEQAARISQGAKSLQRLQDLIRESIQSNNAALGLCEALEHESRQLRNHLHSDTPAALAGSALRVGEHETVTQLRQRAAALESALAETERSALQQIGVTPLTSVAMSSDCNPLNDLSAVADYASKANENGSNPNVGTSVAASPGAPAPGGVMVQAPSTPGLGKPSEAIDGSATQLVGRVASDLQCNVNAAIHGSGLRQERRSGR